MCIQQSLCFVKIKFCFDFICFREIKKNGEISETNNTINLPFLLSLWKRKLQLFWG